MTEHYASDLNGRIDAALHEDRPARYDKADDGWLIAIAQRFAGEVPAAEAQQIVMADRVRSRETVACKRGNKALRELAAGGGVELDLWDMLIGSPITVDKERVQLRHSTADDLEAFANDERRRAARDFQSRNETCEAAEQFADAMRRFGVETLGDMDPVLAVGGSAAA